MSYRALLRLAILLAATSPACNLVSGATPPTPASQRATSPPAPTAVPARPTAIMPSSATQPGSAPLAEICALRRDPAPIGVFA